MVSFKSKKREQAEAEKDASPSKPPVEQEAPADDESSHPPPEAAAPAAPEEPEKPTEEAASDEDVEGAKQDKEAAMAPDESEQPEQSPVVKHAKMVMPEQLPNFRVTADWRGSLSGSMCSLAKGKLIKPRLYGGLDGIERLRQAGVALRRV